MTNIQAADLLKGLEQCLNDYCELNDEGKTAFHMAIAALESFGISEQLPSAQPEIIYCKDCKWKNRHNCTRAVEVPIDDDKYCAWAERRTDETNKCGCTDK